MLSGPEEAQLARAAAGGDGHAFAALYDAYEQRIHNYCLRLLGSEHDADDATQEAFLNVLRRLPQLEDRELDFGAYLFTAARNSSYEMIRKQKRAEPVEEVPERGERPAAGRPQPEDDPALAAMLSAQRHTIQTANARLPERQREVLVLREVEEMSYEQIASLMEMNVNSVAQLISRARVRLRSELRGEEAAAITPASPECERALPLLSLRLDGNLDDEAEREWLERHLASCETCALAAEAMEEAGRSYRAWAPVLPAAYLFRATIAKASEITGSDWSAVARPSGSAGQQGAFQGAGSGTGFGSGTGAGLGAGSGSGMGLGTGIGLGAGVAGMVLGLSLAFPTTAPEDAALDDTSHAERTATESTRPDRASARTVALRRAGRLEARRARAALTARRSRRAEAPPPSQPVAGSPTQPSPSPAPDEAPPAAGGDTAPSKPDREPAGDGHGPREPQRPGPAADGPEPGDQANDPVESPASHSPPDPEPDEPEPQPEQGPTETEPDGSEPSPEPDGSEPTPEPDEPEQDSQPSDEPNPDEPVPEKKEPTDERSSEETAAATLPRGGSATTRGRS